MSESKTLFKIEHEQLGEHVHMHVSAGKGTLSLGKCGYLIMRVAEFEVFKKVEDLGNFEFIKSDLS